MTAPINPATVARLCELIAEYREAWRHWFVTGCSDTELSGIHATSFALSEYINGVIPALLSQLDAQAAEIERMKTEMESPRYQPVPCSSHIIRRCEKCGGLTEVPSALSQCGLVGCRACGAEARVAELEGLLRRIVGDAPAAMEAVAGWALVRRADLEAGRAALAKREGGR